MASREKFASLEFEDILFRVGDFGRYQKQLLLFFLFPSAALLSWFAMNNLFLISVPDHWCKVPELEPWNLSLKEMQLLIRPPDDPRCSRFNLNYTDVLHEHYMDIMVYGNWSPPSSTPSIHCDHGWMYDKTNYESTAATQWDLVCDRSHLGSLVITLANVGSVFATPIYGILSDRHGRKPTFFFVVFVTFSTAIASFLVNNFTAFLVLRGINGSLMPSIFQLPYIILLEIVGPDMRTRMNGIGNSSWTFGLCFLPLVAWLCREWVTFGLVTSSVSVLFFLYWTILPESPRWLLSREKYIEAAKILTKIGERNGNPQEPAELLNQLQSLGDRIKKEKELATKDDDSSSKFFKYPNLRKRFLIITFCWMATVASYYGLQINVPNLGGNEFVNFFLLAAIEIPGYLCSWFVMQNIGRRWCTVASFLITFGACLVPVFYENAGVISSVIGKFGSAAAFACIYQQSSELYPTNLRASGMGLNGTMAAFTNIIVPYLVFLAVYGKFIPFLIVAGMCLLAAFLVSFLPETLHEVLPQSENDAEKFGIHQKYFSWRSRHRHSMSHRDCVPTLLTDEDPRVEMVRC